MFSRLEFYGKTPSEDVYEVSYAQGLKHFLIQPNIQWVKNPASGEGLDDALVLGIRLALTSTE